MFHLQYLIASLSVSSIIIVGGVAFYFVSNEHQSMDIDQNDKESQVIGSTEASVDKNPIIPQTPPPPPIWENNEEIEIFREYLRIPTVHPNIDYSKITRLNKVSKFMIDV